MVAPSALLFLLCTFRTELAFSDFLYSAPTDSAFFVLEQGERVLGIPLRTLPP